MAGGAGAGGRGRPAGDARDWSWSGRLDGGAAPGMGTQEEKPRARGAGPGTNKGQETAKNRTSRRRGQLFIGPFLPRAPRAQAAAAHAAETWPHWVTGRRVHALKGDRGAWGGEPSLPRAEGRASPGKGGWAQGWGGNRGSFQGRGQPRGLASGGRPDPLVLVKEQPHSMPLRDSRLRTAVSCRAALGQLGEHGPPAGRPATPRCGLDSFQAPRLGLNPQRQPDPSLRQQRSVLNPRRMARTQLPAHAPCLGTRTGP